MAQLDVFRVGAGRPNPEPHLGRVMSTVLRTLPALGPLGDPFYQAGVGPLVSCRSRSTDLG